MVHQHAVFTGNLEKIIELFQQGELNIYGALLLACLYGHLDIVKFLVSIGADVCEGENSPLVYASRGGSIEVVDYLISLGATADKEIIKYLEDKNINEIIILKLLKTLRTIKKIVID